MSNVDFYRKVDDYRGYMDYFASPIEWRLHLRKKLLKDRDGKSDLSQRPLTLGFDLHEGIYTRAHVPKSQWQHYLFSGVNCFLLMREEHIPTPPSRVECYWLAVSRYGRELVDGWIDSLPFKSTPDKPWIGTYGGEVLSRIRDRVKVASSWDEWYKGVYPKINMEA